MARGGPGDFPPGTPHGNFIRLRIPLVNAAFANKDGKKYVSETVLPQYRVRFNMRNLTMRSEVGQVSC